MEINISKNAKTILRGIDLINGEISALERERQKLYNELSLVRKQIEKDNSHLIGKEAMCTHIDSHLQIKCVCTAVIAHEDLTGVKPLFSKNGKKFIALDYEWI
jgi:hypothetical protein